MDKNRTIRQIIDAAGGPAAISEALDGHVTADAVAKWRPNGIPDRYWSTVIPLADSSADEIFAANEIIRAEKAA